MPRGPSPIAGVGIVVPIFMIVVAFSILFFPLSPSITGTISLETGLGYPPVQLKLVTVSYSHETLVSSYSSGSGKVALPVRPAQNGTYTMTIQVTYGNTVLVTQAFDQIGDGVYVFKVMFSWRQESPSIPYVITITITNAQSIQLASTSFSILPS